MDLCRCVVDDVTSSRFVRLTQVFVFRFLFAMLCNLE